MSIVSLIPTKHSYHTYLENRIFQEEKSTNVLSLSACDFAKSPSGFAPLLIAYRFLCCYLIQSACPKIHITMELNKFCFQAKTNFHFGLNLIKNNKLVLCVFGSLRCFQLPTKLTTRFSGKYKFTRCLQNKVCLLCAIKSFP